MCEKGVHVSRNIVRKLLKKHKFKNRKMQRMKACGDNVDRNQQFEIISAKKESYNNSNCPIISVDTKKKEYLGNLHRDGKALCTQPIEVYDHDYNHMSDGKIVPHGIYDLKENHGYLSLGTNYETAEFVCDSMKAWWHDVGKLKYPNASKILILLDSGGANSYRHHIFKIELQKLANEIGVTLEIAHYPPYTSKWNPIEHRVFPHVGRQLSGLPLLSAEDAKEKIEKTKTTTGMKVVCKIIKKTYEIGKRATRAMVEKINIKFDELLAKFNYSIAPEVT